MRDLENSLLMVDSPDGAGFEELLGHEREKLERLCRTITRPDLSTERLSLTSQGNIRYRLKTPYRDGTTEVVFEPLDKIVGSDFEPP